MNHQFRRQLIKLPIIAIAVLIGTGNVLGMPAKGGFCETFDESRPGPPDSVGFKGDPGAVAIEQTPGGSQVIIHRPTIDDVDKRNTNSTHGPKRDPVIESPEFTPQFGTLFVDLVISEGGEYIVGTQDTEAGMQNAMVRFNPDGTIDAFRVVQYMGLWEQTTGSWTPGVKIVLGIEVLPNGEINILQDGEIIYMGFDTSLATGKRSGIGQFFVRDPSGGIDASVNITVDKIELNCA